MKHLFAPYELALLAKEKGFNERGMLAYYTIEKELNFVDKPTYGWQQSDFNKQLHIAAPLYQQLVDWLELEKGIIVSRTKDWGHPDKKIRYSYYLINGNQTIHSNGYVTFDRTEALNKALNKAFKLI